MFITNNYDLTFINTANKLLKNHISTPFPTNRKEWFTPEYPDYIISDVLKKGRPVLYDASKVYKTSWKKDIYPILKTPTDRIFINLPTLDDPLEILWLDSNNNIKLYRGSNTVKAIFSFYLSLKNEKEVSPIDLELNKLTKNPEALIKKLSTKQTQAKVDAVFGVFDTTMDFFQDLIRQSKKSRENAKLEMYKAKLLYILQFNKHPDPEQLRKYNVDNEEHMFRLNTSIKLIQDMCPKVTFTNQPTNDTTKNIAISDILNFIQVEFMEEKYLDYLPTEEEEEAWNISELV